MNATYEIIGKSMTILNAGYRLIEIKEEPIPLARIPEEGYFGTVIAVMLLMAAVWVAAAYLIACWKYRVRIRELRQNDKGYYGWNLKRLRDMSTEMELQRAEQIVEDMQSIFKKNISEA